MDNHWNNKLRQRAARNRRSINVELREIVSAALAQPRNRAELKKLAANIRALSVGRPQTPSEDLLRESREER